MGYQVKNRIWINAESGTFLAEGRIELLQFIEKEGSISKAAKAMKISYKKAWELVHSMNKNSKKPLMIKIIGGKKGGGSELTEYGKEVIEKYHVLKSKSQTIIKELMNELDF